MMANYVSPLPTVWMMQKKQKKLQTVKTVKIQWTLIDWTVKVFFDKLEKK